MAACGEYSPWVLRVGCLASGGTGVSAHIGHTLGSVVNGNRKLHTFWSAPLEVDSFGWKD